MRNFTSWYVELVSRVYAVMRAGDVAYNRSLSADFLFQSWMFMLARIGTWLFVIALVFASNVEAQQANGTKNSWPQDSWPQWGGPNRDHKSLATALKQEWPDGGPAVAWKFADAGAGYSSLAVVSGRGYTLGTIDGKNVAICIDTSTGKQLWRSELAEAVPSDAYLQGWGGGPRSTPTVVGNRVVVLDDGGTLASLDAASAIFSGRSTC